MPRVAKKKSLVIEVPDADSTPQETVSHKRISKPSPTVSVMGFLLCMAVGMAGYFYYQYTHTAEVVEAREIQELVEKIGKAVVLPQGEIPTLATVTNKEKLGDQPFFKKAENGDKILIYADASQAILYRPATGKIIDMTTVNIEKDAPPQLPETAKENVTPPVTETVVEETTPVVEAPVVETTMDVTDVAATVVLYNGSTRVGVTNAVEEKILEEYPSLTVSAKEKATQSNYVGTLVIDLSGKNVPLATGLAEALDGAVGDMPVGEVVPQADILIIVGNKS